jgi:DNA-3-methyladenine glycosylase
MRNVSQSKNKQLPRAFYERSPEIVARALLGKIVRNKYKGEWLRGRVLEVEAYLGTDDAASHTFGGETERNRVLFGPAGVAYVYFIYGMYYCLNVSCLPEGEPGGVLFRALAPLAGTKTMARLRGIPEDSAASRISGGPGRLCQALGITRKFHNGVDLTARASTLQLVDDGYRVPHIDTTPRIGIRKAAALPLRFLIPDTTPAKTSK